MRLEDRMLLRINLSTGSISKEVIDNDLIRKYLGGRGLGSKLLAQEIDPKIDPLSPENKLIFANGLLTGTMAPTSGRYMVVTKGPLTGTITASNSGGFFGAELSHAGYMILMIEGKAESPVYISIKDDVVAIKDAVKYWGLDTHKTTDHLRKDTGDPKARVACIGPAGERKVLVSCIINDKNRAAARTGVGAVMGSKNLKAVVVRGTGKIDFSKKEAFKEIVKAKRDMMKKSPLAAGMAALGTKVLDSIINMNGIYPTKNFQYGTFGKVDEVNGEALVQKGYLKKNAACYACPLGCGRRVTLPSGRRGEGPEYESGWSLGADCGVGDLIAITEANFLCNELGLDTISCGATIACAMELYEKGFIPLADLKNGPELKFGSSEAIVYYTQKMALREGFGDKLAEGSYRLADAYGHPEFSMSSKKQELPAYDVRGVQGQALACATSNRGGCHVRGYMIPKEIMGVPEKLDPKECDGKAQHVKTVQDLTAMLDSTGLCLFTTYLFGIEDYQEFINAATEFHLSLEEVQEIGERIWNLERIFNIEAGISPDEDTLPERLLKEPLPDGPQKGAVAHLHKMLPDYYHLRGWSEKGIPDEMKLKSLGIL